MVSLGSIIQDVLVLNSEVSLKLCNEEDGIECHMKVLVHTSNIITNINDIGQTSSHRGTKHPSALLAEKGTLSRISTA